MVGGGVSENPGKPEEICFIKYEIKRKRPLRKSIWEERIETCNPEQTPYGLRVSELQRRLDMGEIRGLEVYLGRSIINPSFM